MYWSFFCVKDLSFFYFYVQYFHIQDKTISLYIIGLHVFGDMSANNQDNGNNLNSWI